MVAGGDGTIRDAAERLVGSGVPMAIVPAGTANVFAAALGVPRRIKGAIELIATGRPMPVDVGQATWGPMTDRGPGEPTGSRAFVVACGLGFDARVMAGATPELKRQLGFGAYVVSAARQAARLRPVDFRIEADGVVHEFRGLIVLLANCGQIVPRLVGPRRPIDPTDGFLEVIVIRASGRTGGLVGLAEVLVARRGPARATSVGPAPRPVGPGDRRPAGAGPGRRRPSRGRLARRRVRSGRPASSSDRDRAPARLARPMTDAAGSRSGRTKTARRHRHRPGPVRARRPDRDAAARVQPLPGSGLVPRRGAAAGAGRRHGGIRRLADHRRRACWPRA